VVTLAEVRAVETRGGTVRYVSKDTDGNEYTTFREDIGERAKQLQGTRVRLEYHEEQRGRYHNVYLDKIEPAEPAAGSHPGTDAPQADTDPEEAAWQTAVAAAPWLVGQPGSQVPPDKLYEKLKPFEERVAADIEEGQRDRMDDPDAGGRAG
jgi:hypothetical protein